MSDASLAQPASSLPSRTPWHLWLVGVLSLLWNLSGAITIWLAQAGRLPDISAAEAAYYAAQPLPFVIVTGVSPALASTGALVATSVIFVLAILQFLYAKRLAQRDALR